MSEIVKVFVLLFVFCADIQVHAGGGAHSKPTPNEGSKSQPELGDAALLVEKRTVLSLGSSQLVVSRGGLLRREGAMVQLIRGSFYFDGTADQVFKTPFVTIRCADGSCRMLIERARESVEIKNLSGNIILQRNGEAQNYFLPTATQVSIGAVTMRGFADMEFPQSLPWSETARKWADLFPGSVKEFKSELEEFRPIWREAVEAISHLHLERANREIASADRAAEDAAARAAQVEKENAKLRQMFRRKNHFD